MLIPLLLNNLLTGTKRLWRNRYNARKYEEPIKPKKRIENVLEPVERDIIAPLLEPEIEAALLVQPITPIEPVIEQVSPEAMRLAVEEAIAAAGTVAPRTDFSIELAAIALEAQQKRNQLAITLILASI